MNWAEQVKKYYIDFLTVGNTKNVFARQESLQGEAKKQQQIKIAPITIFSHVLYV